MSATQPGKNSGGTAEAKRGRQFSKGASGNPSGRPKKDFDLVTRCQELTPDIIERYAEMGARAKSTADVAAGRVVIEYGYDKPRQRHELTGANGKALQGVSVVLTLPANGRDVKDE
jgi:hypothetical protein